MSSWEAWVLRSYKRKVRTSSVLRAMFYRTMARNMRQGADVLEALRLCDQTFGSVEGGSRVMAVMMEELVAVISEGGRLASGLYEWVPDYERLLIEHGDEELAEALTHAMRLAENAGRIGKVWRDATRYPILLVIMAYCMAMLMAYLIFPEVAGMLPRKEWHGFAAFAGNFVDFISNYSFLIVAAILGIIYWVSWTRSRDGGRVRRWADRRLPPWAIFSMMSGVGFLLAFASLSRLKMDASEMLERMSQGATPWLQARLQNALYYVVEGKTVGDSFYLAGDDFPNRQIVMELRSSTRSGIDVDSLDRMADEWAIEGEARVKSLGGAFLFLGMLFVAVVLVVMMGGVMVVVYQLKQKLDVNI